MARNDEPIEEIAIVINHMAQNEPESNLKFENRWVYDSERKEGDNYMISLNQKKREIFYFILNHFGVTYHLLIPYDVMEIVGNLVTIPPLKCGTFYQMVFTPSPPINPRTKRERKQRLKRLKHRRNGGNKHQFLKKQ